MPSGKRQERSLLRLSRQGVPPRASEVQRFRGRTDFWRANGFLVEEAIQLAYGALRTSKGYSRRYAESRKQRIRAELRTRGFDSERINAFIRDMRSLATRGLRRGRPKGLEDSRLITIFEKELFARKNDAVADFRQRMGYAVPA